ncbi:VanW family protein [Candidatus Peregrinibacteria bacterium]|nr:VanW family protein [Candidatus Peregrinibacteria bacterium]
MSAKVGDGYSAPFGLVTNTGNEDLPVSRIKALESLLAYFGKDKESALRPSALSFADVRPKTKAYATLQKGCSAGVVDCGQTNFNPFGNISQADFLDWFFKLKYSNSTKPLETRYPSTKKESTRHWLEAKRLNLISSEAFTHKSAEEFLYRHSVSEANLGLPYNSALSLKEADINADHYHNLTEIDTLMQGLRTILSEVEGSEPLSSDQQKFVQKAMRELGQFEDLKASLVAEPYILKERSDFDSQITQLIRHFGLQEVLYRFSYDYSANPAYRKHNLTTGVKKMHAKLLMPGEILDYWKQISDKNLWDFKYGWVIADGGEKWAFGGGICGSATVVFIPAWKAGLEVLERRNHSLFYSDLYPKAEIGLDATVYRPKPNLRMRNSLNSPVLFNVNDDTQKQVITIEVIGNPTYKSTTFEGPLFSKGNVVKWVRHLEGFDGNVVTDTLESRYNAIY